MDQQQQRHLTYCNSLPGPSSSTTVSSLEDAYEYVKAQGDHHFFFIFSHCFWCGDCSVVVFVRSFINNRRHLVATGATGGCLVDAGLAVPATAPEGLTLLRRE
uniref:Uncharacterized protein n=1 Tax=Globodera rostochiensis TaxID=31243 RepID=A0A914H5U8_GLORO